MKKRIRFILLVIALLFVTVLSGCCLSHEWVEADCVTPKTCAKCEKTEGEALGHTWAEADCVTPKTCTVCSATEGEALGHTWSEATCLTAKTCDVCAVTAGEPLGHQVENWHLCADNVDNMEGTCSACGEVLTAETDWVAVAGSRIIGKWNSVLLYNAETSATAKYYDDTVEFREDGTASLNLAGLATEATWEFYKFDDTYINLTYYAITLEDGSQFYAYFMGKEAVNLTFIISKINVHFVRAS